MNDSLRVSALTTLLVGLVAEVCLAGFVRSALDLSPWYPVKATGAYVILMLLALGHVRGRHPFARIGPANQITTARAALVLLVASVIGERSIPLLAIGVVVVALIATLLDGVDGWVARRTRMTSEFGSRFDMETDALLILVLAILTWQYGKAGRWVLASGLLRYVFAASGRVWPWMRRPLPPTLRGRMICVVQIVALIVAMAPIIKPPLSAVIAGLALGALCYSFLIDTLWLWKHGTDVDATRKTRRDEVHSVREES